MDLSQPQWRHAQFDRAGREVRIDVMRAGDGAGSYIAVTIHGIWPLREDRSAEYMTEDASFEAAMARGLALATALSPQLSSPAPGRGSPAASASPPR